LESKKKERKDRKGELLLLLLLLLLLSRALPCPAAAACERGGRVPGPESASP
jgi:hypothetical protein